MQRAWVLGLFVVVAVFAACLRSVPTRSAPTSSAKNEVLVVPIEGAIGPATADFVVSALDRANEEQARAVILRLDTPGGLDTSMRVIVQAVLASRVPVIGYVAPSGARAASAGTFIMYATHLAAMAPGTNLGAATPVALGGGSGGEGRDDEGDASAKKAVNDAVAYIESLAELRGRNAEWAARAVRSGESLAAVDAERDGVIELVASDLDDLQAQAQGRTVVVAGVPQKLMLADTERRVLEPGWASKALAVLTNPNIVVILLLLGVYGLFFELASPGGVFPGVMGVAFLLLGLYGLHVLPVTGAGLLLLALGVALIVAEAFVPSFGVLGLSGIGAIVLGGLLLIDDDAPGFTVSPWGLGVLAFTTAALLGWLVRTAVLDRRRPVTTGQEGMLGARGVVLAWRDHEGEVLVQGERWQAQSVTPLSRGDRVRVRRIQGLVLGVERTSSQQEQPQP